MEKILKQKRNRRYYLHRRIRLFYRLSTRQKTIYVPYCEETGGGKKEAYINELRDKYGYAVQTEIT